ncbi:MAG: DUF6130 family protein [Rhodanobacteraceae bacterium]
MKIIRSCIAAMVTSTLVATNVSAQSAREIRGPSPLIAIPDEPAATLIVDPPLAEPLTRGLVFIQYRTENLRVVPVFGSGALSVSPRIGHVHITVDDAPWHFVDASGETIIVVGLKPGPHQVLVELADPTHRVITSRVVAFTVPVAAGPKPSPSSAAEKTQS